QDGHGNRPLPGLRRGRQGGANHAHAAGDREKERNLRLPPRVVRVHADPLPGSIAGGPKVQERPAEETTARPGLGPDRAVRKTAAGATTGAGPAAPDRAW